jgi:hypothetical protein
VYGVASFTSFASPFTPKYSPIISLTISAVYEPCHPFSTKTTTAISGFSYGANPANHAFTPFPVSEDPVLPPISISKSLNTEYAVPPCFCRN